MIDEHHPDDGHELRADLCVIGAGPAGIAISSEFLNKHIEVLLVESGGHEPDAATELLNEGENAGECPLSFRSGRTRALGGAGRLWAGQCMRLTELDFERRPWVPHSGWALTLNELLPHYERAEQFFEVAGEAAHDHDLYSGFSVQPPAFDPDKLGYMASVYAPRPDVGARWRAALKHAPNIRVLLNATATRLVPNDARSAVRHALVRTPDGRQHRIAARAFVLCAGGIENARLLLASDNLANDRDLVGRFLQDHPNGRAATLETRHTALFQDSFGLLYRRRFRFYPKLSLSPHLQRQAETLNCAAMINSDFTVASIEAARRLVRTARGRGTVSDLPRDLARVVSDAPRIAHVAYRRYVRGLSPMSRDSVIWLQTYAEQAPNAASRIRLSDRIDQFGVPLPAAEWRFTEQDRRTAELMIATIASECARLDVGLVHPCEWLHAPGGTWAEGVSDAYHPSGTTRMSEGPAEGVVDRHCQVHGVDGLYIAGSSVFPTVGFANPTLTIVALALRVADRLKTSDFNA